MLGLGILVGFHLAGMLLQHYLSLPLPANVTGLILFVAALFLRLIRLEWVEQAGQFLLKHMMLFFAPLVAGSYVFFPFMRENWLSLGVSWMASTLMTLLVTGWMVRLLSGKEEEGHEPFHRG